MDSDLEIGGRAQSPKIYFLALRASVWSRNEGGGGGLGPPGPPPGCATAFFWDQILCPMNGGVPRIEVSQRRGSSVKSKANKTKQKGIDNSHANYFLIF